MLISGMPFISLGIYISKICADPALLPTAIFAPISVSIEKDPFLFLCCGFCRVYMASSSSALPSEAPRNNAAANEDLKQDLLMKVKRHEIAITELNHLQPFRAVYLKNGKIFFRENIKTAITSEQKHLDLAKAQLQKFSAV